MTEALAQALSDRVAAALPFLAAESGGRAVGLARLYTERVPNGEQTVLVRLPVPAHFTASECEQNPRYLVPDASTPAILLFEDGGSQPTPGKPPNLGLRTASLRLLLWVNPLLLDGPLAEPALFAAVTQALRPDERQTLGAFTDVLLTYQSLPAETSLYARYSFAEAGVTPLLRPPYRLLGLALTVQFRYPLTCPPAALLPGVTNPAPLCP